MRVEPDVWVHHPAVNCGRDVDRVTFLQLGIELPPEVPTAAYMARLRAAILQMYPGIGGDLARLDFEWTERSLPDAPELIFYEVGTPADLERMLGRLSPARAES